MLWLGQGYALKAFRAFVGDEEGHELLTCPQKTGPEYMLGFGPKTLDV